MTGARVALWISAALFAGPGMAFLLRPHDMAARVALELTATVAASDVRAVFGGLELGFAVFLALGAARPVLARPALAASVVVFAGMLFARMVSLALDGVPGPPGPLLAALEGAGLLVGVAGVASLAREP